jgi:hypothetical protein
MTTFDDVEVVQRRAGRLSLLLARTDAPPRPLVLPVARIARAERRLAVRWRIAAAVALLIAGAAGVPPVRAWIADTVRAAWRSVTGRHQAVVPPAPAAPTVTTGAVSFAAPDPLTIRIARRQTAGGTLTIERTDGLSVSAAVTGEANAAELVVGPEGLRIVNRRASTAGYVIRVPAGLSRIVVQVEQERPRIFGSPAAGDRYVVDLGVRSAPVQALK